MKNLPKMWAHPSIILKYLYLLDKVSENINLYQILPIRQKTCGQPCEPSSSESVGRVIDSKLLCAVVLALLLPWRRVICSTELLDACLV